MLSVPPAERDYQDSVDRRSLFIDMAINLSLGVSGLGSLIRREEEFQHTRYEIQSEIEHHKKVAHDAVEEVNMVKMDKAEASKAWSAACKRTNQETELLRSTIESLKIENSRLNKEAEQSQKSCEEKQTELADTICKYNIQHNDLLRATTSLSDAEAKIKDLVLENSKLQEEKVLAESSCSQAKLELDKVQSSFEEATDITVAANERIARLMSDGAAGIFKRVWNDPKLTEVIARISSTSVKQGLKLGFCEGFFHHADAKKKETGPYENESYDSELLKAYDDYEHLNFEVFELLGACMKTGDPAGELRKYFIKSDCLGEELAEKARQEEKAKKTATDGGAGTSSATGDKREEGSNTDDVSQYLNLG